MHLTFLTRLLNPPQIAQSSRTEPRALEGSPGNQLSAMAWASQLPLPDMPWDTAFCWLSMGPFLTKQEPLLSSPEEKQRDVYLFVQKIKYQGNRKDYQLFREVCDSNDHYPDYYDFLRKQSLFLWNRAGPLKKKGKRKQRETFQIPFIGLTQPTSQMKVGP